MESKEEYGENIIRSWIPCDDFGSGSGEYIKDMKDKAVGGNESRFSR